MYTLEPADTAESGFSLFFSPFFTRSLESVKNDQLIKTHQTPGTSNAYSLYNSQLGTVTSENQSKEGRKTYDEVIPVQSVTSLISFDSAGMRSSVEFWEILCRRCIVLASRSPSEH